MEPLAYRMRPKTFDDLVGQENLVGKNGIIRKMVESNKLMSIILFGPPGCGKTTIARIIKSKYSEDTFSFNASVDNKKILQDIADSTKFYRNVIVIIDEIHRMKKDTQDFLLPFLENGSITIIGLTTSNPYISINPAIRSRTRIYQLKSATNEDIKILLTRALKDPIFEKTNISDEVLEFIANKSGGEIRTSLNMLETLSLLEGDVTLKDAENALGLKALKLDSKDIYYYDLLSALQKSIRGSDVDAALLYLAKLIKLEDLDIIIRRLSIISYEDIGLANPQASLYVNGALETARNVGFPEARIPLSFATIVLALSPKSNSSEAAIDKALADVENLNDFSIPKNILNREIKGDPNSYKYPHDFPGDIVYQEYMPKEIRDHTYYSPKETGKYEKAVKEYLEYAKKVLKK